MSLYSLPVGTGADSERVEERLTENCPREQAVDGTALTRHPYRVIDSLQGDAVVHGQPHKQTRGADVPGVDDEAGLYVWNNEQ